MPPCLTPKYMTTEEAISWRASHATMNEVGVWICNASSTALKRGEVEVEILLAGTPLPKGKQPVSSFFCDSCGHGSPIDVSLDEKLLVPVV